MADNATSTKKQMTEAGKVMLEERLQYLRTVKRAEIAERIETARSFGDLSENAEYDAAKNEQAYTEGEIMDIENQLRNAEVVDDKDITTDVVRVGLTVRVLDEEMQEELTMMICGSAEANADAGKISNESPIGAALLGHKKGQKVTVATPGGNIVFKILSITKE